MTASTFFLAVLATPTVIILLVLGAVALALFLGLLLVFIQQWRGRSRWRAKVQDMQERRKHAGAAGAAQDCRYDPRLFRGRR